MLSATLLLVKQHSQHLLTSFPRTLCFQKSVQRRCSNFLPFKPVPLHRSASPANHKRGILVRRSPNVEVKRLSCSWCRISNRAMYVVGPVGHRNWRCRGHLKKIVLLAQLHAHQVAPEGSCYDSLDSLLHHC